MEDAFAHDVPSVLKRLDVDVTKGLSYAEVERRKSRYGPNAIPPPPPSSFFTLVLKQFEDLLVLILLGAAAVSFGLACLEDGDNRMSAFMEPAVIMVILICNAIVGVLQETNAEKAIEKLKEMDALEANVLRQGKVASVDPTSIVPGDIVLLSNGDKVPADLRLVSLSTASISFDESSLTGEAISVQKQLYPVHVKDPVDQDKSNMCFRSTLVTRGKGIGVAVLTGSSTSIGRIQSGIQDDAEQKTPLQKKLDDFGEQLSKVILVICILVWLINVGHFTEPEHGGAVQGAIYYFKIAVALAVAAIPEGLPAVVTTCLALGTMKMAKKNAIVRSLPSVETLGCTTVICSDKTGTLTTNKMIVQRVLTIKNARQLCEKYSVDGNGWSTEGAVTDSTGKVVRSPSDNDSLYLCSKIATLCNDAHLVQNDDGSVTKIGESTEAALKVFAEKIGVPREGGAASSGQLDAVASYFGSQFPRQFTLEFHRERKSMSVVVEENEDRKWLLVKGAPESVLERCSKMHCSENEVITMSKSNKANVMKEVERDFASNGLRCIALAYRKGVNYRDDEYRDFDLYNDIESKLTFVGIVGMLDPPRPEVIQSLSICRDANIRVIMITGDNKETAMAIGSKIDLFPANVDSNDVSFTGSEFFSMNAKEQKKTISEACLFARVEPMHKQKLVTLLQGAGEVVAMTGDGVNDAPALKRADIGIAMGSGTAVAKEASDMVLQDDNFATIVMAVEEGRAIYANTKQFIRYLISSNIGEVACIFLTAALGIPEALIPVQLLWVNLVTDGLPATALGFNKPDADIMKRSPRGRADGIINGWMFFRYMSIGIYIGAATVMGYIWWFTAYPEGPLISFEQLRNFHSCGSSALLNGVDCSIFSDFRPSTVSLSILVTIEMFNTFNALSEDQSLLSVTPWSNPWVVLAVVLSFMLHFAILYIPALNDIFLVSPLVASEWLAVLAFSAPVLALDEVQKLVSRLFFSEIASTEKAKKE